MHSLVLPSLALDEKNVSISRRYHTIFRPSLFAKPRCKNNKYNTPRRRFSTSDGGFLSTSYEQTPSDEQRPSTQTSTALSQVTNHKSQITSLKSQVSNHKSQVSSLTSQISLLHERFCHRAAVCGHADEIHAVGQTADVNLSRIIDDICGRN